MSEEIETQVGEQETPVAETPVVESQEEQEVVQQGTSSIEMNNLLTLMANNQRAMRNELASLKEQLNKPVVQEKPAPVDGKDWLQQPEEHTRRVVREVISDVMGPTRELTASLMEERQLTNAAVQYVQEGGNKDLLVRYKDFIPQVMQGQPKTVQALNAALLMLAGQEFTGQLKIEGSAPINDKKETPNTMKSPTTRSTPSVIVKPDATKDLAKKYEGGIQITEAIRAYAKKAGVTDDAEILDLLNADSGVDSWNRKKS